MSPDIFVLVSGSETISLFVCPVTYLYVNYTMSEKKETFETALDSRIGDSSVFCLCWSWILVVLGMCQAWTS